ncbi:hypothetical protein [Micromonospora sp. NPDC006431]|uniref:hypothetical protein n=1 Tax=Micromonospora sp. NPDC006431 TaxID=3364235 RepID=UPI0036A141B8
MTGRVVDLASPVVAEVAEAGLLKPVGSVLRPLVEPIVDVLPPALDPVLDLTQPIIGPPATATDPVVTAPPAVAAGAPAVTAPTALARPAPPVVANYPAPPAPPRWSPPAGRGAEPPDAAALTRVQWPGHPGHTPGATPAAPARTAASGSAHGGISLPADACRPSWAPDLHLLGLCAGGCDPLADRSYRPDPRPA